MPLSISGVTPTVGEIQRRYLYKLMVEDYPVAMKAEFSGADAMAGNLDLLNQTGFWPNRKTSAIEYRSAGERIWFSGQDDSEKTFSMTFIVDQEMKILDFWEAAKNLTGDLVNHAAMNKPLQTLTLGVYMVDVQKKLVTDYRRAVNAMVLGIEMASQPEKQSNELMIMTVTGNYDTIVKDISKRGKSI
jgi:hypothetical protein